MFITEQAKDQAHQEYLLKRNRLTKFASIASRTLSVLVGNRVSVSVVEDSSMSAPAWSSTKEVWLNLPAITDDTSARGLISLQGLGFHEYSHLRYTPRNAHPLTKWVRENGYWEAFNCLEDSRIENLTVAHMPSVGNWLVATITDYLMSDPKAIETAYPLVVGRKYLPAQLQQLAVDNYLRRDDIDELADIVEEYIQCLFVIGADDTEKAKPLIQRFHELLQFLPPQEGGNGEGGEGGTVVVYRIKNPNGHNSRPTEGYESSSTRPASKAEQERDRERANKANEGKSRPKPKKVIVVDVEEAPDFSDNESATKNPSANTSKEDNSTPTPSASDDEDNFGDDEDNFGDDEADYQEPTPNSNSKSAGKEQGKSGSNQQVTDVLDDVMKDIIEELSKEVRQIAKQLGINPDLDGGNAETPRKANYIEKSIPEGLLLLSRSFGKELERLRAKYEPAWETQVDTGRLNVTRYLQGEDFDTVFDEWQEGKSDVTAIEAVILLDKSGSMAGNNADNAYKSMWAIKKALEQVEARVTVVTFDYGVELLYSADEKAGTTIRDGGADGGTNPERAIMYAKRVLAESAKPIKVLFMITDGAWQTDKGEKAVDEMRGAGVLTCQAYLSEYDINPSSIERYRHSFELLTHIKSASDILTLGRQLVRLAIQRNLVSH